MGNSKRGKVRNASKGCARPDRTGWDIYTTNEVLQWIERLDAKSHNLVVQALDVLAETGPGLGRPLVDVLAASVVHNLKELRPGSAGRSEIRILFAFDPWRCAILLVAGDKSNNWNRWYDEAIPRAEMNGYTRWADVRADHVERAGGEEAVAEGAGRMLARNRMHPLIERREELGLTQAGVAESMGVPVAVVHDLEAGKRQSGHDLALYIWALGGTARFVADFDDRQYTVNADETSACARDETGSATDVEARVA